MQTHTRARTNVDMSMHMQRICMRITHALAPSPLTPMQVSEAVATVAAIDVSRVRTTLRAVPAGGPSRRQLRHGGGVPGGRGGGPPPGEQNVTAPAVNSTTEIEVVVNSGDASDAAVRLETEPPKASAHGNRNVIARRFASRTRRPLRVPSRPPSARSRRLSLSFASQSPPPPSPLTS